MEYLAKKDPPETLELHTEKLLSVFRSIRIAYPEIPKICGTDDFYDHLFYSIVFHDLGKTASGFQNKWSTWGYRHEILSAGLINLIPLSNDYYKKAIMLAVISHHKTLDELKEKYSTMNEYGNLLFTEKRLEIEPAINYINSFFKKIEKFAEIFLEKAIPPITPISDKTDLKDIYKETVVWYLKSFEMDSLSTLHKTYGIFLRGSLITCDHLASAQISEIKKGLTITNKLLGIPVLYPFQSSIKDIQGNGLLEAPTGSGKTEASLLWANNNIRDNRIFYILPYTASINAMNSRFSEIFGVENIGMLHNKAAYYIYMSLMNDECDAEEAASQAKLIKNTSKKFYKPLKIVTPFQIFKTFFGVKGWETMITEMNGAAFIFDEIHVYDPRTLALIMSSISYLVKLNCKFLFLSATFPTFLKSIIKSVLPEISEIRLNELHDHDKFLMNNERHKIALLEGNIVENISIIQAEIKKGKNVLVVCNTVQTAQDIYSALESTDKALIHGRFMLKDRERIEKMIMQKLPNLLVGTQVIEVSLNLDFDVIFTEAAPIDAIVQRLGRVNRKGLKGISPAYIFKENSKNDKYFYNEHRIERTLNALSDVDTLSQKKVNEIIEKVYYDGFTEVELKTYTLVFNSFKDTIESMVPFIESEKEEEYFELIKSYQIIPSGSYEQEFCQCLEDKRYFDAMRYYVNISIGQVMNLNFKNAFKKRCYRSGSKNIYYFVADTEYDDQLGLLINKINEKGIILD